MKQFSIPAVMAIAVLLVPLMAGESSGQAQTQQINYAVNNTTGFQGWSGSCCYGTTYERCGNNAPFTLSWTDQIGSTNVRIEVRLAWGTCCVGNPSLSATLNNTAITSDTPQPSGLNASPASDCTCRQTAFQTSGRNYTLPSTNSYNANGTNTLSLNFSSASGCNLCLANNSSNWCAQVTVVGLNQPPAAPTNLHQAADSGGGAQPVGFISDNTIFFRATVTDPDAGNTVGLEAEILPSSSTFGTNPTGTLVATPTASFVASGSVAEAALNFTTANLPSGSYKWRVRAKDNIGAAGPWVVFDAAPVHFTTDLVPPTTPVGPYSPTGVQLVFENEPQGAVPFSWGSAFDPSGPPLPIAYRLEVSATDTFSSLIFDADVPGTSTQAVLPAAEVPYFWRVRAVDVAGNFSQPSASQPFQVSWTIPPDTTDRHANCGVSMGGGSALMAAMAVASALMGIAVRRRRV